MAPIVHRMPAVLRRCVADGRALIVARTLPAILQKVKPYTK
jgi:hypothetical protein